MKRKNLIIGISAFFLAVCGAFVSPILAPEPVFARIKMTPMDPFVCRQANTTCANYGTWVCTVGIPTIYGYQMTPGRQSSLCTPLSHTNGAVQYTSLRDGSIPYDVE